MTAPSCKRRFRNCNEFGLCVNIGQNGYVLAEDVETFESIFLYVVKGNGKIGKMFKTDYLDLKSIYDKPDPVYSRCFLICFDGKPKVNGKELKRFDYSEVKYPKDYNIELNGGALGFFIKTS